MATFLNLGNTDPIEFSISATDPAVKFIERLTNIDSVEIEEVTMEATIKTLAKARKANRIQVGTVLRFTSGGYTYAAVYVGGKWWITGTGRFFGKNVFMPDEFITQVLQKVTSVEVATEWADV